MRYRSSMMYLDIIVIIALLLCGCAPTPISGEVPVSEITPQVIIQGSNSNKEEIQTIELDNCDGKGNAVRTEQRSQSIDVTISAELAAKLGASAEVISAEVHAAVGIANTQGAERSTSIQLAAPPGTRMIFQLVWTGEEQIGIVQNLRESNIPIAFQSFLPMDVRIKGQSDIGCPNPSEPMPVITTQAPISVVTTHKCIASVYTSIGDDWVSPGVFLPVERPKEHKIFSHCPPGNSIQYNAIVVDDDIKKVELVCSNSVTDITGLFTKYRLPDQILDYYKSQRIETGADCRIDFTVADTLGVNIGLMIKSSE